MGYLQPEKTSITAKQLLQQLYCSWIKLFNTEPSKNSLLVLLSQSSFESGRWKKSICYCLAGIKSVDNDGKDYTFFTTNEILKVSTVNKLILSKDKDGGDVVIKEFLPNDMCKVYFYPQHKYCKFRAYTNLEDSVDDYLSFLYNRYKKAWVEVLSGDPANFVDALKKNGYFTGDLTAYRNSVVSLYKEYSKLELDIIDKEKVLDSIQISLQELSNEIIK